MFPRKSLQKLQKLREKLKLTPLHSIHHGAAAGANWPIYSGEESWNWGIWEGKLKVNK